MWLEEEGCKEIVEEAWGFEANGHAMAQVEDKIGRCQSKLNGGVGWLLEILLGN